MTAAGPADGCRPSCCATAASTGPGACWTGIHQRWLGTQRLHDPQLQVAFVPLPSGGGQP
jgi:hypothetical protein